MPTSSMSEIGLGIVVFSVFVAFALFIFDLRFIITMLLFLFYLVFNMVILVYIFIVIIVTTNVVTFI